MRHFRNLLLAALLQLGSAQGLAGPFTFSPAPDDRAYRCMIKTSPAECEVFINGELFGTSPSETQWIPEMLCHLKPGTYEVTARKEGYIAQTQRLEVLDIPSNGYWVEIVLEPKSILPGIGRSDFMPILLGVEAIMLLIVLTLLAMRLSRRRI